LSVQTATQVVVVAETQVFMDALELAFHRDGRVRVMATARSGREAALAVRRFQTGLVLISLASPDGLVAAREIRKLNERTRIVAFGVAENERDVIAWAEAGAAGCVGRNGTIAELTEAVIAVANGEFICSPTLVPHLFQRVARLAAIPNLDGSQIAKAHLTKRESEITNLVAHGMSNKQIAQSLQLSEATVKNHVHRILEKLGARRRSEIVIWSDS
jgi:two-component system nitrate/nitrite response regulator NarL